MHQAQKGNQWYFGMKAHIGVHAESGLVHGMVGTAANVANITLASEKQNKTGGLKKADLKMAHGANR